MPATVFKVSDVDEAIELAETFKKDGKYDWFRGQTRPWPPYSSGFRLRFKSQQERHEARPRFLRYYNWLKETPGLEPILNDGDAVYAVAQHYGLPTDYIDFTTDPSVAGFFACDTTAREDDADSCIYCLNTANLRSAWDLMGKVRPEYDDLLDWTPWDLMGQVHPEYKDLLDFVVLKVPNLWRLEAQSGVFLYCPSNWDALYPMDRIVFPFAGYPSYPTRADIYPASKSHLEILLDQFFDNEAQLSGWPRLLQFAEKFGVTVLNADEPADNIDPTCLVGATAPKLASWQDEEILSWLAVRTEAFDPEGIEVPFHVTAGLPSETLRASVTAGFQRILAKRPELRRKSVDWKIVGTEGSAEAEARLATALRRLWDGMRIHPYDDDQIAQAAGACVALFFSDFPAGADGHESKKRASRLFGESIRVQLVSHDGAYSDGYAAVADLLRAVRPDIAEHLKAKYRESAKEIDFLLQVIFAPDRLFEFDRLVELFALQLIPTQVLLSERVVYFSPARLWRFGLP